MQACTKSVGQTQRPAKADDLRSPALEAAAYALYGQTKAVCNEYAWHLVTHAVVIGKRVVHLVQERGSSVCGTKPHANAEESRRDDCDGHHMSEVTPRMSVRCSAGVPHLP